MLSPSVRILPLACSVRSVDTDRSQPFVWMTPAQSKSTETVRVLEGEAVEQEDLRNSPTSQTVQESMYTSEAEAVES